MFRNSIKVLPGLIVAIVLSLAGCGGGNGSGNAPNNTATVAEAGAAQNVSANSVVALDGFQSTGSNGSLITYLWTMATPTNSNAALVNPTEVNPTFTPDMPGQYLLTLKVTDAQALSSEDTVTVTVTDSADNASPVADAGTAQIVMTNSLVTLDGSKSSDANGDLLTYSWSFTSQPGGSSAALLSATVAQPTFTADISGVYVFNLVVNDGTVNSASAVVAVTASNEDNNAAPVARAGSAQSVVTGEVVTLDGSASRDANGDALTYRWAFTSKPHGSLAALSNAAVSKPTFTADVTGAYVVNLVVNDGTVNSAASAISINANINAAPVAKAGFDRSVVIGTVTLNGSTSSDANGDALTYRWAFTSTPDNLPRTLSSSTAAKPYFTANVAGAYVLNLVVNDGNLDSAAATVTITAMAAVTPLPVANAEASRNVIVGGTVTLDGSLSDNAAGDPMTYSWSFTSRPAGSTAALSSTSTVSATFIADKAGAYVISLVVNDGKSNSLPSTVTVTAAAPYLQLSRVWFNGSDDLDMPFSQTSSRSVAVSDPTVTTVTVDTFKLTATGASFTVSNLSPTGTVAPCFTNLSNGKTIAQGTPVAFSLVSPITNGTPVHLTYSFTITETGETFTYIVNLTTN